MNLGFEGVALTRRQALGGCASALASPSVARAADPLLLGLTPVFVDSDFTMLKAIELELSGRLRRPVTLVKRRTYQEIMAMLLTGQVTAAWICGYPYVRYRDQLSIVAVPIYKGAPLYRSYFIARADLPGATVADFRGRPHAFSDPDSNSGWLEHAASGHAVGQTSEGFTQGEDCTCVSGRRLAGNGWKAHGRAAQDDAGLARKLGLPLGQDVPHIAVDAT